MGMVNPYSSFGSVVVGPTRFIGRDFELRRICSRVFGHGTDFGSLAIVGLPRVGKTSLVYEAIRRAEAIGREELVVTCVDVSEFGSSGDLFRAVLGEIRDHLHPRSVDVRTILSVIDEALDADVVNFGSIRRVFGSLRRNGVRAVCVFDEFDASRRLSDSSPQFYSWFRELASNPRFGAPIILIAKRRLQDIADLGGYGATYWSNVFMVLPLASFVDRDVSSFFARLHGAGVSLTDDQRARVTWYFGGIPYLLDKFAYYACEAVLDKHPIEMDWIDSACKELSSSYFRDVCAVFRASGLYGKAVQAFVGPQYDITEDDMDALFEVGIARDVSGHRRCFSDAFENFLMHTANVAEVWPLWGEVERSLREFLEGRLRETYRQAWEKQLVKSRPRLKEIVDRAVQKRIGESSRYGSERLGISILAYMNPDDLFSIMCVDWPNFGQPLLSGTKGEWAAKFRVLSRIRNPYAHNRSEVVPEYDRLQARGICEEIRDRWFEWHGNSAK